MSNEENLKRIRVKDSYADGGREGCLIAIISSRGRDWACVQFDDSDDPDLYKREAIEVGDYKWGPL